MQETVLISLPITELQTVIIDCVNACLKSNKLHRLNDSQEAQSNLITIDQAAELLQLAKPTIYSKHSKGEIPGICKVGKKLFFEKDVLIQWIKESRKFSDIELEEKADTILCNTKKGLNNE